MRRILVRLWRSRAGRLLGRIGWTVVPERLFLRLLPSSQRYSDADILPSPPRTDSPNTRLFVGPVNYAGQGHMWAKAAEGCLDGVSGYSMSYSQPTDFQFAVDQRVPGAAFAFSRRWHELQRREVTANFTHVLVEAERPIFGRLFVDSAADQIDALLEAGVKVAMVAHGSDVRLPSRHARRVDDSPFRDNFWDETPELERLVRANLALLDQLGLPTYVSTPDLLLDVPNARWLPVVVEFDRWQVDRVPLMSLVPHVAHVSSQGVVKGTALIEPTLRRLEAEGLIRYTRIEGDPPAEMPALYRDADVVLDQFRLGDYGVAACEALASGCVVVGHVSEHARAVVAAQTGWSLPIVESSAANLDQVLRKILSDRPRFQDEARRGVEFVREVHDGSMSANRLAEFLEAPEHDVLEL